MHLLRVLVIAGVMTVLVGPATRAEAQDRGRARGDRVAVGRAVPRGAVRSAPRVYVAPRYARVAPVRFYRPYYTFRPHWSLGFGLWAGDPFAYPYAFYNPFFYYPYDPSYSDDSSLPQYPEGYLSSDESAPSYSTSWSSMVEPDQTNLGGLSFDVTPATAEVFVDNMRVGTVGQFTPTTQPVGLAAGHHHIEIRTSGYQTMSFDVDIVAGEVTPFQGTMERD